jgi:hypothetical protein
MFHRQRSWSFRRHFIFIFTAIKTETILSILFWITIVTKDVFDPDDSSRPRVSSFNQGLASNGRFVQDVDDLILIFFNFTHVTIKKEHKHFVRFKLS